MDNDMKEVYFGEYCKKCKYSNLKEYDSPCDECLDYPTNLFSHKPVEFKEKDE